MATARGQKGKNMLQQDEQLFGAPPGALRALSLQITSYDNDRWGVWLLGHQTNRRQMLEFRVTVNHGQELHTVIGALTPLLQRSGTISVNGCRRHMWALHSRLGRHGYEVSITGCGAQPKH